MKKTLILIAAIGILTSIHAEDLSQASKDAAGRIIAAMGYPCNVVDNANRHMFGNGIDVYCDDYRYGYVLQKEGGRYTVKVK